MQQYTVIHFMMKAYCGDSAQDCSNSCVESTERAARKLGRQQPISERSSPIPDAQVLTNDRSLQEVAVCILPMVSVVLNHTYQGQYTHC